MTGVDGIFCLLTDSIDENIINKAGESLKVISTLSVGYDHLDVKTCKARNIRLGNTPRVLDIATAEIVFLDAECKEKDSRDSKRRTKWKVGHLESLSILWN